MMLKPIMIENEKDFSCFHQHQLPIISILLHPNLSRDQRFLCTKCMNNIDFNSQIVGLSKAQELIFKKQSEKMELLQGIINQLITLLEKIKGQVQQLKSKVFEQFDQLMNILDDWCLNVKQEERNYAQFSFLEELENMILEQESTSENKNKIMKKIQQINQSYNQKVSDKFKQLTSFQICDIFYQLNSLECQNQNSDQDFENREQQINKKSQIKLIEIQTNDQKIQEGEVKFELIDQSVMQQRDCTAIAFNSSGSIMISNEVELIKVWSFNQGKINLITTLQGHSDWIYCLNFSREHNSFISGAADKTIRCWKQINQNDWASSKPEIQHKDRVMCIAINSKEDLLFSGSCDKSIKVWNLDLNNNELFYLYSLNKHKGEVIALSLNQSENYLVSCAVDKNSIIVWKRNQNDKFKFQYFIKQQVQVEGLKLKFIKENQLIWITGGKELDQVRVIELEEGTFQEKQERTITLEKNTQVNDEFLFPIIYNQQRNLILIRHKKFIYIIREIKNGMYQIVQKLSCDSVEIYGTITYNGQYLVFWDKKNQQYSIYELLNI